MKRCAISVLTAAILMAWEPVVMPISPLTPPAAQEEQTQSSLADPANEDRAFCGWETLLLLMKADPQTGQLRRGSLGRTSWYCVLGLAAFILFRLLYGQKLLFAKTRRMPYKKRTLPLGSHAPPAVSYA